MIISDNALDTLYLLGFAIAWGGMIAQIIHMYRTKKARDFSSLYLLALICAKLIALPRTIMSNYWVWWMQQGISTIITLLFVITILYYRKRAKER